MDVTLSMNTKLWFLILFLSSCNKQPSSQLNDESSADVEVMVKQVAVGSWKISYELNAKTDAFLILGTTADSELTDHLKVSSPDGEPSLHFVEKVIGEQTFKLLESTSGEAFSRFSIALSQYDAPNRWFKLFRKFSDGIALFSGHFRGYTVDFEGDELNGMEEIFPKFTATPIEGSKVVTITGESDSSVTFPTYKGANGAYIYFGNNTLQTHNGISFLTDPEIPDDAAKFSRDVTASTLNFYTKTFAKLRRPPVVFLNHSLTHDGGASGSSLDGQFLVTIYGNGYDNGDNPWESLAHVIIHEVIHQWNAIDARDDSETDASWIWEGGAELLTLDTLRDSKLITQKKYNKKVNGLRDACVEQIGAANLMAVIDSKELAKYRCGQYFQQLAVRLLKRQNSSHNAYTLWKVIFDYAQENNGKYTIESYYETIKSNINEDLYHKLELLKGFPYIPGNNLKAAEATLELE